MPICFGNWQCNGGDRQGGIENNERNKNIWDSNDPGKKELRSKVGPFKQNGRHQRGYHRTLTANREQQGVAWVAHTGERKSLLLCEGAWCDLLGSSRFWGDDPLSVVAGSTSVAGNV